MKKPNETSVRGGREVAEPPGTWVRWRSDVKFPPGAILPGKWEQFFPGPWGEEALLARLSSPLPPAGISLDCDSGMCPWLCPVLLPGALSVRRRAMSLSFGEYYLIEF